MVTLERLYRKANKKYKRISGRHFNYDDFIEHISAAHDIAYARFPQSLTVTVMIKGDSAVASPKIVYGGVDTDHSGRYADLTIKVPTSYDSIVLHNRSIRKVLVDGDVVTLYPSSRANERKDEYGGYTDGKITAVYIDRKQIILPQQIDDHVLVVDYIPAFTFELVDKNDRLLIQTQVGNALVDYAVALQLMELGDSKRGGDLLEKAMIILRSYASQDEQGTHSIKMFMGV